LQTVIDPAGAVQVRFAAEPRARAAENQAEPSYDHTFESGELRVAERELRKSKKEPFYPLRHAVRATRWFICLIPLSAMLDANRCRAQLRCCCYRGMER
jgi:hypothetical protein